MSDSPYSPWLHRVAQLTVAATLLLIFMGGLVTSHGAGMSVPDWPNSYGYNMFTFPIDKWVGGIFYEHTHRLMATVVGTLAIVTAILAWIFEPRRWVRWLAVSCLLAVILQGVLGGLRVTLVKLGLAMIHACVAQAVLCLLCFLAVVTSRWWLNAEADPRSVTGRFVLLAAGCTAIIYAQLIVGAVMRHNEAGLAIPDFPLSYGRVLPPTDAVSLASANQQRIELDLPPVTLRQVWLHAGHRIGALLVTIMLLWLIIATLRRQTDPGLRVPATLLIGLLIGQLTLGILTVLLRKPADIASLHVAVGALTLMMTFLLSVRAIHLHLPKRQPAARGFEVLTAAHGSAVPA